MESGAQFVVGPELLVSTEDNLVTVDHLGLGMGSFRVAESAALVFRSWVGIEVRGVQRGIVAADPVRVARDGLRPHSTETGRESPGMAAAGD